MRKKGSDADNIRSGAEQKENELRTALTFTTSRGIPDLPGVKERRASLLY